MGGVWRGKKKKKKKTSEMFEILIDALRYLGLLKGGTSMFDDPIWRPWIDKMLKPRFRYFYPGKKGRRPPRPNFIFGGMSKGKDSLSRQLAEASQASAEESKDGRPPRLFCLFGRDEQGKTVWKDFCDIRQMLITGSSGSGKTSALTELLLSMLYGTPKELLEIEIFDIKGDFLAFRPLADVWHQVEPEKGSQECPFLRQINKCLAQMRARAKCMASKGFRNIEEWNEARYRAGLPLIPYKVKVIDEFASTVGALRTPEGALSFQQIVEILSAMGRSAGFYVIIATQRPDAVCISSRIKANVMTNLSFAQSSNINARVAGVPGAEELREPGQAILCHNLEAIRLKTPYLTGYQIDKFIARLVVYRGKNKKSVQPKEQQPKQTIAN